MFFLSIVMKTFKWSKIPKHYAQGFFFIRATWRFPFFENLQSFNHLWRRKKRHNFVNIFKIIINIFNNSQKLILNKFTTYFFMKITIWTVHATRTIPKLVTPKISRKKGHFPKKYVFLKIQLNLQLLSKVQPSTIFLSNTFF